ncbi:MAG: TatD family hydrolase [Candidatus Methanomethylophilaceae archaeon]
MFGDAHLHYKGLCYDGIEDASLLCVCAAELSDWDRILSVPDVRVVKSYGIHPWYADQWDREAGERLRSLLDDDPKAGVGEIGLDYGRGDAVIQATAFTEQLIIASEYGRFVSVHNVRSEGLIQKILKTDGKGCGSIIMHSFSGPIGSIPSLVSNGCYFSVSPRLMLKSRANAELILDRIPEDRLLIETDAPDVPGSFTDMGTFMADIAEIKGVSVEELAGLTLSNLREAVG